VTIQTSLLAQNIAQVRETIARACQRAGRSPESVRLVAVSKTRTADEVAEAVACGLRHFGENRVQEAAAKIPAVAALCDRPPTWDLIGTLQRNKVRQALELFSLIQSVDSVRLAEAIAARAAGRARPILLEVYLGDDPNRPGFRPADLPSAVPSLAALPGLELRGLMTVAPLGWDQPATRQAFANLRELRDSLEQASGRGLPELSMGMTDDYPLAIAEGATIVRVGRAIFGERPQP
jgi:pyridoxal phosphate enzyme (YggS family)